MATTAQTAPPPPRQMYETRSAVRSSRIAFGALLLRDLVVLRKHLREFIPRTIVQPLLLVLRVPLRVPDDRHRASAARRRRRRVGVRDHAGGRRGRA